MSKITSKLPKAKIQNTVVQQLEKELLIYDLDVNKAYCLNETLAIVYKSCDGKTIFSELELKSRFSKDLIVLSLFELSQKGLLENSETVSFLSGLNRRELIKKVGLVSIIALPIISSIVAPKAVMAQSCVRDGQYLTTISAGGACGSALTDGDRNSFCNGSGVVFRCCSGVARYNNDCTTNPGPPPFQFWTCNCGA